MSKTAKYINSVKLTDESAITAGQYWDAKSCYGKKTPMKVSA